MTQEYSVKTKVSDLKAGQRILFFDMAIIATSVKEEGGLVRIGFETPFTEFHREFLVKRGGTVRVLELA